MSETMTEQERQAAAGANPYLAGNFAPVSEEITAHDLEVEGNIPPALCGMLLRDGPNPIAPDPDQHWFVGDGMIHGITIKDGSALTYRNRWIRTPRVEELLGLPAGRISPHQPRQQGSGNVNVIHHGGRILALPEIGLPWEVDAELNTIGQYDYGGALRSNMTAHPKIDPATGELVFFGYDFGPINLRYHFADRSGTLVRSIDIAKPVPTMMHDFGVTATRVVFMDFPVAFDMDMAKAGSRLPFRWRDDLPARLGILPRDARDDTVQWFNIDPCFVFHPLNAFDDGDTIFFDVVRHDRTFVNGQLGGGGRTRMERWTIDPARERIETEIVSDYEQEFPRVDPRVECHPHRYGYAVCFPSDGAPGNLLKHDLEQRTTIVHDVGAGGAASEGIFVPCGSGEDEGYVLSVVYDQGTDKSHVRVIDAQDFGAPPVAKIQLPVRVPFGFHGNWIAAT